MSDWNKGNFVQTRSEETGIKGHASLEDAMHAASQDETIWKISFSIYETGERVRLVKENEGLVDSEWVYQPIRVMAGGEEDVDDGSDSTD